MTQTVINSQSMQSQAMDGSDSAPPAWVSLTGIVICLFFAWRIAKSGFKKECKSMPGDLKSFNSSLSTRKVGSPPVMVNQPPVIIQTCSPKVYPGDLDPKNW